MKLEVNGLVLINDTTIFEGQSYVESTAPPLISKNDIKFIRSLQRKKGRDQTKAFIVEGEKLVIEAIRSDWDVQAVYYTEDAGAKEVLEKGQAISRKEMDAVTALSSASPALAIVSQQQSASPDDLSEKRILYLDAIRDPGNLGTIIRTADWFGVDLILCSDDTVDCFNPKVVMGTMGSIFRMPLVYVDLAQLESIKAKHVGLPFFGAFLDGEPLAQALNASANGVVVIGNEAQGIRSELEALIDYRITIKGMGEAESLNAAISTAIVLYEWMR